MDYDIAIVGCGPVGATLANLLSDYGYSIAIFEKEMDVYRAPRAVHIDDEVVRIFQTVGILNELKANIVPFQKMQFLSTERKVLLEAGFPMEYQPYGYAPSNWFFQPILEEKLRAHFQQKTTLQFYKGYEVFDINNLLQSVQVKAREDSSQKEISLTAKYLIGCDGGKSLVRKTMSVPFENLNFDQAWMVVDTFVKAAADLDLLPALHQQICDPYRPITYVPGVGNHRRFEFMLRADETPESIAQPEKVTELLQSFINPNKLEIARSAVYTFHGLTVSQWKKGRLLLAGDSAHQMPPFAGQGMCSGIRDAHNLAFKLDLVLKGLASEKLLDTYQAERKPHVTAISKGAINMGKLIQTQNKWKARLRDFQFFLARNISFIQAKMQADFVKKESYKKGFFGNAHALVGHLTIQPKIILENEQTTLLDELLGNQFALVSQQELSEQQGQYFKKLTAGNVFLLGTNFSSTVFKNWIDRKSVV